MKKYNHIGVRINGGGSPDYQYKDIPLGKNPDGSIQWLKRNMIHPVNLPLKGNSHWKVFKSEISAKKWLDNIKFICSLKPNELNNLIETWKEVKK